MDEIKLIKGCIEQSQANQVIDYINTNIESFYTGPKRLRFQKQFGNDKYHLTTSAKVISGVKEIEHILKNVIDFSLSTIAKQFDDQDTVYLASLWLAKQVSGAEIKGHIDTDSGINNHYEYSSILYLSTPKDSSPLEFPLLGKAVSPEFGDMILFKSADKNSFHMVKRINEDRYSIPMWFTKDKNYELKFGE